MYCVLWRFDNWYIIAYGDPINGVFLIIDFPQNICDYHYYIIRLLCGNYTINNNRISQQQLWNAINIAVIVLYFWIYNVFLDLTWYFCNHVLC